MAQPDAAAVVAYMQVQEQARRHAEEQSAAVVARAVRGFNGWYEQGELSAWIIRLTAALEVLQRWLARSTDTYLARSASTISGRTVRPVGAIDVSRVRGNVPHAQVVGRIADTWRYQTHLLETNTELVSAVDVAIQRGQNIAATDLQLVTRQQSQAFMVAQPKLTGYRRMIHPELSKHGTSCGLCIAASDRLYGPRELLPIHDGCNCVPLPVYDRKDPGSAINAEDLRRMYEDAGSTSRADLKRVRYQITEHGELGPVLTPHGQPVAPAHQSDRH